jgi:predicted nucleic acid-binding Zn ribbon protein
MVKMGRKKNKDFTHIGSLIGDVIKDIRPESDSEMLGIWTIWGQAVGEAIAVNARPHAFKGGLLMVNVAGSVWAQQLQFQKNNLIRKINSALGKDLVADIRFRTGKLS